MRRLLLLSARPRLLGVWAALTLVPALALAAAAPERWSMPGVAPGEQLALQVLRPPGHVAGTPARYLWVLDGDTSFAVAAEAVRLVALECETPPPVLVAVGDGHAIGTPGNRRSRDYTPVASDVPWARGEGGGARWLAALRERVLPAVEARVGPALERTLYGHSYGGLAVAQAWLQSPALSDRWVLASPALYYGGTGPSGSLPPARRPTARPAAASCCWPAARRPGRWRATPAGRRRCRLGPRRSGRRPSRSRWPASAT